MVSYNCESTSWDTQHCRLFSSALSFMVQSTGGALSVRSLLQLALCS